MCSLDSHSRVTPPFMEFDAGVTAATNGENSDSVAQPINRKRRKSIVWEHFTVESVGGGCTRAYCKQCNKSFSYINDSKLAGTSHLKRHITLGICQVIRQQNEQSSSATSGDSQDTANPSKKRTRMSGDSQDTANPSKKRPIAMPGFAGNGVSFDQERSNHDITKMIILHDYPLNIVEHQGFIDFVRFLQPQFSPLCLNSVEGDCVSLYAKEKQNMLNLVGGIPGRVNLTLDLWNSNRELSYVFVRGHFVDADWNLHHRILNVVTVPFPISDDSLNQTVVTCLTDWKLEGRLFTLGLDKSFSSETLMGNIRDLLSFKNLSGQLLNRNCYARVLSRLALEALQAMPETVGKVREHVKYVKSSGSHEGKFIELKKQLRLPSMVELILDDQSKWDTTYRMLAAASRLKEVFACFDTVDPDYRMSLTMEEWKQVETLCTYLKYVYDAAKILTLQPYPTANIFFPEVSKLQEELVRAAFSHDPFLRSLIMPLHEKFDQYWRESCVILAMAVAMDPRHKMKLVEFTFAKVFGENAESWIRTVDDGLRELFIEYNIQMLPFTSTDGDLVDNILIKTELSPEDSIDDSLFLVEDGLSDYEFSISDFMDNKEFKLELDEYLEEPLHPNDQGFDVLCWWRSNGFRYPTLSRIASDLLSIPLSTVSADDVFDTQVRKMDSYRSSLSSTTLEALICAKEWLQYKSLPTDVSDSLVKMEF